ncbi:trace amine-associated receptor 7f-like [Anneissia japonica]|uniref:trace amine-associated receptor 7f-like n=1 Tax=Anneissia japonica TaxID=1529436 RepID=UPI0014258F35|nr:trace amine-associated receptor 7f-like [Anneissia japonica]
MEGIINTRNITTYEMRDTLIFILTICTPLDLVIICGNAFVLIFIRQTPSLQVLQFTLIASLALVDLLTGIIAVPLYVLALVTRGDDYIKIDSCNLLYIPLKICLVTSFFHLLFITTDRYVSIIKPLKYRQIVTQTRVFCAIIFSWITASAFSFTQLLWKGEGIFLCYQSIAAQRYMILIMFPTGMFLLIKMYFRIFMEARKHRNTITAQNTVGTLTTVQKNVKAAKTSALMVCCFIAAYLPYSSKVFIILFIQRSEMYWYDLMSELFICIGSAVNPFIYVFRHKQFSSALRRLLRNKVSGELDSQLVQ